MVVVAGDIKFFLSGGASNQAPDASLGGVISDHDVVATELIRNLFDDVTAAEASAGVTDYRCYYVKNTNASDSHLSHEVWISAETPSADTVIDIGLDPAGINGTATTISTDTTAPSGVTFSHPTGSPGLSVGTLAAGDYQAVWVRRTVNSSATVAPLDEVELHHTGTDS